MKFLIEGLLLVGIILGVFFYIDSNLEKTIDIKDLIKISENREKTEYSARVNGEEEIIEFDIKKDSEIILITGNNIEKNEESNEVKLHINRPNKNVILVINTQQRATWNILPTENTKVDLVIYSGKHNKIISKEPLVKYQTKLDLPLSIETNKFLTVLSYLNKLTNIEKISHFYAKNTVPSELLISTIQENKKLSINYLKGKKIDKNVEFRLITKSNKLMNFDLYGPLDIDNKLESIESNIVASPNGKKLYKIIKNGLKVIDLELKTKRDYPVPAVRKIHRASGIAYDSISDMIYLANKTGKFYVFDAVNNQWKSIRKYIDDYDINSLAYDKKSNLYVSATWKKEGLIFFDQKGNFIKEDNLSKKLRGLNYHFNKGDDIPKLMVFPNGEDLAIVLVHKFVHKIWYYNTKTKEAVLTYNYYSS